MDEITVRHQDLVVSCTVCVDWTPNIVCTYEENETGLTITGHEGTLSGEVSYYCVHI